MTFEVESLQSIRIHRPVIAITEDDIETVLDDMRLQKAKWKSVTREARTGDRVVIYYHGEAGGHVVDQTTEGATTVILGSHALHAKLEDRLAGRKSGDSFRTTVKYKHKDTNPAVAGERVHYEVEIHKVFEAIPPKLNAGFARGFGIRDGSLKRLRKKIRDIMRQQLDKLVQRDIREQVFSELLRLHKQSVNNATGDAKAVTVHRHEEEDNGYRQRLLAEIMKQLIRDYHITFDQKKETAAISAIAIGTPEPKKTITNCYENDEKLADIYASVLENQVIEFVLEHARLKDEPISYHRYQQRMKAMLVTPRIVSLTPAEKCGFCARNCCTYITAKIPTPHSKKDFSFLLWQVAHQGVSAFKESAGWYLQFETVCEHLAPDNRCGIYNDRMQICREYSNQNCEFEASATQSYELVFQDHKSLLEYCRKRFKTWTY